MYMIKVLLADDQELIRESLGFVLGAQGDITVVGMAKNGREAIELVRSEKPDVVLMDIRMPEVDGVECTRLIKSAHPNIKVIVLTTFDDDEYVFNALRFGASGYLLKGVSVADLTNAVREVVRGGSIIAPDVASKALEMFARMAKGNLTIGVDEKQTEELQDNEWRIIREVGAGPVEQGDRGGAVSVRRHGAQLSEQHPQQARPARPHAARHLGGADRRSRAAVRRSAVKGLDKAPDGGRRC